MLDSEIAASRSHRLARSAVRTTAKRMATETYSERMQREEQEATIAEEQHSNLKEALEQLSGPDRAVLSLRYEEEFDTAEIACNSWHPGRDREVSSVLRQKTTTQIPGERQ